MAVLDFGPKRFTLTVSGTAVANHGPLASWGSVSDTPTPTPTTWDFGPNRFTATLTGTALVPDPPTITFSSNPGGSVIFTYNPPSGSAFVQPGAFPNPLPPRRAIQLWGHIQSMPQALTLIGPQVMWGAPGQVPTYDMRNPRLPNRRDVGFAMGSPPCLISPLNDSGYVYLIC